MTYLEILIRTTKREIRTLKRQLRDCSIWAAFLYIIVLLNMLIADGTYTQARLFAVAIFTLSALVWIIRAHHAHLLLEVSKARKAELDAILNEDAPHLHAELRKDGGVTFAAPHVVMPGDMETEITRVLRHEGMKRKGPTQP